MARVVLIYGKIYLERSMGSVMSDLIIQQGTDDSFVWPVTDADGLPIDLTGWSVSAQVRNIRDNIVHEWNDEEENVAYQDGLIYILWTSTESAAWTWTEGKYDLEATLPGGNVIRLDQGFISLAKEVTR